MDPAESCATLNILIIGAGLCGLGAAISIALEGHRVTVFESAPELHTAGAGIQVTPNGLKLLRRWGVTESLKSKASVSKSLSIIRYDGRKILAHREHYGSELEARYGEPIWSLHRVDLQKALAVRAEMLGVRIMFDARAQDVDLKNCTVIFGDGRKEKGDLIVAADGLWSSMRSNLLGKASPPCPTGDLAYRILLTADQVKEDEELHRVVTSSDFRIWLGPRAHAVSYSLLNGQMYNIVLLMPDDLPDDVARVEGDVQEMARFFNQWDPLLTRFLSYVKHVDKWRLMALQLEDRWFSEEGTFVLAGDSAHPILPYLAQGANSALEDAATLGSLLGQIKSKVQIPPAMALYDRMRKERNLKIREQSNKEQDRFHLPDGESQRSRDEQLAISFEPDTRGSQWQAVS